MGEGRVYIVGAGPGASDLITLRGLRILREADVLICDYLLPRSFLEDLAVCCDGKEVVWLAAKPTQGTHSDINERLRRAAQAGKIVVRLQAGDPFVFGRGREEVEFLTAQGIPWEVIPGPSSCTAALSAAGLPLTRRRTGRSFAVVTARCEGGAANAVYPLADSLIVLMGVSVLEEVVARLLADGWPADTPAAMLERITLPGERRVHGPLSGIVEVAQAAGISPPAILVVGTAASV